MDMRDGMKSAHVVVVGAGIGGLAGALRLAAAGCAVTVVEAGPGPGGKMRPKDSVAGPVDTGPTVLTLRHVFDDLFDAAGERLDDHLRLIPLPCLARHLWDDGTVFDLMADPDATRANLRAAFGPGAVADHDAFTARARRLFNAFDAPMMQAAEPSSRELARIVLSRPSLLRDMAPHRSLDGLLRGAFREPRLRQLYGRYATYVGGMPHAVPALLALISQAEAAGVWMADGGMHRVAQVIEGLARARGVQFQYGTRVQRIEVQGGRATGVSTTAGRIGADAVLFNGDPRALATGLLGDAGRRAVPLPQVESRSLSAWVHAFAATLTAPDLPVHTVCFGHDPAAEFRALAQGRTPTDATLYLCAQDRAGGTTPAGPERFEIILNAPPVSGDAETEKDIAACQTQVFDRLEQFGLRFSPRPDRSALMTPADFARTYPGSLGSLYGQSPSGLTAGLKRPRARTAVAGLFLCGGGAHPGAGVPMATLSARHAAEAIRTDLASRLPSRPAAMPGGISMPSRTTAGAR